MHAQGKLEPRASRPATGDRKTGLARGARESYRTSLSAPLTRAASGRSPGPDRIDPARRWAPRRSSGPCSSRLAAALARYRKRYRSATLRVARAAARLALSLHEIFDLAQRCLRHRALSARASPRLPNGNASARASLLALATTQAHYAPCVVAASEGDRAPVPLRLPPGAARLSARSLVVACLACAASQAKRHRKRPYGPLPRSDRGKRLAREAMPHAQQGHFMALHAARVSRRKRETGGRGSKPLPPRRAKLGSPPSSSPSPRPPSEADPLPLEEGERVTAQAHFALRAWALAARLRLGAMCTSLDGDRKRSPPAMPSASHAREVVTSRADVRPPR